MTLHHDLLTYFSRRERTSVGQVTAGYFAIVMAMLDIVDRTVFAPRREPFVRVLIIIVVLVALASPGAALPVPELP